MTTSPVLSITDELLAELDSKATAATPQRLDSTEHVIAADPNAMIECPICHGEGYASLENDYCNFDNHAIGVQFYGIGPSFGLAEEYFRAANPATILALTAHIRSLTERLEKAEKAEKDSDRLRWLIRRVGVLNDGYSTVWLPSSRTQINANDETETRSAIDAAIAQEAEHE